MLETKTVTNGPQPPRAVFQELGSVVTVEQKWSLEGVFPSRAVFKVAARHETRCEWATAQRFSVAIYWLAELAV